MDSKRDSRLRLPARMGKKYHGTQQMTCCMALQFGGSSLQEIGKMRNLMTGSFGWQIQTKNWWFSTLKWSIKWSILGEAIKHQTKENSFYFILLHSTSDDATSYYHFAIEVLFFSECCFFLLNIVCFSHLAQVWCFLSGLRPGPVWKNLVVVFQVFTKQFD